MKTEFVKLSKIKPNKANPRVIKDAKFHLLVKSILVLPSMLELRPIVVNNEMVVLGGNMRLKALEFISSLDETEAYNIMLESNDYNLKSNDERLKITEYWNKFRSEKVVPIVKASNLTDAEQKEFIIKDNASFGDWDYDMLANEFDSQDLNDWGVDVWNCNDEVTELKDDDVDINTAQQIKSIKVGKNTIQMTDEEFKLLQDKVNEYVEINQNTFGFINWLINGESEDC